MEYVDSTDPSVCCGTCKPKGCYHNNTRYNSGDVIPSDKPCKEMTCVTNNGSPQWFTDKITCTEPRRYCLKVCFTSEKIIPLVSASSWPKTSCFCSHRVWISVDMHIGLVLIIVSFLPIYWCETFNVAYHIWSVLPVGEANILFTKSTYGSCFIFVAITTFLSTHTDTCY